MNHAERFRSWATFRGGPLAYISSQKRAVLIGRTRALVSRPKISPCISQTLRLCLGAVGGHPWRHDQESCGSPALRYEQSPSPFQVGEHP
jgi:hypothetical protein